MSNVERELARLNEEQLRVQLFKAYSEMRHLTPEPASVRDLKQELYRRGYEREGVIEIAVAALIHQAAH